MARPIEKQSFLKNRYYTSVNGVSYNNDYPASVVATTSSGVEFPSYKDAIANHSSASTSYSTKWFTGEEMTIEDTAQAYYTLLGKQTLGTTTGSSTFLNWGHMAFPGDVTSARDRALAQLKSRLASDTKQFNLIVPLAEARELRGLITQIAGAATSVVRGLIDLKHGRIRDASKRAGDLWLGFGFGVQPLLSDAESIAQSLAAYFNAPSRVEKYTGVSHYDWVSSLTGSVMPCCQFGNFKTRGRFEHSLKYKFTAGVLIDMRSGNDYSLSDQLGLKPGAIIPTAWELVPFSWVVDYFTTAGDYLSDVFMSDAGNTVYCTLATKYTCKCIASATGYVVSPAFNYSSSDAQASSESGTFTRTVYSGLPHRAFRVKTADEIGMHSIGKLLNLASLLVK